MKRILAAILAFVILLSFAGCGNRKEIKAADELILAIGEVSLESEAAIIEAEKAVASLEIKDQESLENLNVLKLARVELEKLQEEDRIKKEQERVISLVTSNPWCEINSGSEYQFTEDGKGTHDGKTLSYIIEDGIIIISEGTAGKTKVNLVIDESGDTVLLNSESNDFCYVSKEEYQVISEEIKNETKKELTSKIWAVHNGPSFLMYYFFSDDGSGTVLLYNNTQLILEWEFVENDTIRITIDNFGSKSHADYDVVVDNGSYILIQANNSAVTAVPQNY